VRQASACAGRSDIQLPVRTPIDLTLFTRLMPAANSGASNPLSTASPASLRMADMRMIIDEEPGLRASSDAPSADRCFAEARPRLQPEPGHKFLKRHVVNPACDRRRHVIEHKGLQSRPLGDLFYCNHFVHLCLDIGR
jgi:hypothetical protein